MAEATQAPATAAERARQRATGGAPPAPKPVTGAELFALLPQVILFMVMWHSLSAHQRAGDVTRRAEQAGVGTAPSAPLEQAVPTVQEADGGRGAGMGGVGVGVPEQNDMAKFPVRYPMWSVGQKFELYVYLSSSDTALNYSNIKQYGLNVGDQGPLLWHEHNLYL